MTEKKKQLNEKRLAKISEMEEKLNKLSALYDRAEQLLDEVRTSEKDYLQLSRYYFGQQWLKDYRASNRGEVPPSIPHGVLSEDAIYDAVFFRTRLAKSLLILATEMLTLDE